MLVFMDHWHVPAECEHAQCHCVPSPLFSVFPIFLSIPRGNLYLLTTTWRCTGNSTRDPTRTRNLKYERRIIFFCNSTHFQRSVYRKKSESKSFFYHFLRRQFKLLTNMKDKNKITHWHIYFKGTIQCPLCRREMIYTSLCTLTRRAY